MAKPILSSVVAARDSFRAALAGELKGMQFSFARVLSDDLERRLSLREDIQIADGVHFGMIESPAPNDGVQESRAFVLFRDLNVGGPGVHVWRVVELNSDGPSDEDVAPALARLLVERLYEWLSEKKSKVLQKAPQGSPRQRRRKP